MWGIGQNVFLFVCLRCPIASGTLVKRLSFSVELFLHICQKSVGTLDESISVSSNLSHWSAWLYFCHATGLSSSLSLEIRQISHIQLKIVFGYSIVALPLCKTFILFVFFWRSLRSALGSVCHFWGGVVSVQLESSNSWAQCVSPFI